jgi:hypothetical protein
VIAPTEPDYVLHVPRTSGWLTANQRLHHMARARLSRQWRDATAWRCRHITETFTTGVRVVCELRFHGNRRRDPGNWAPTAKAIVDGMVDAGLFPDDNAKYVTGPDMRLGEPVATKGEEEVVVHVWRNPS